MQEQKMKPEQQLAQFEDVPIRHGAVASLLRDYKRPNDKISTWIQDGLLTPITARRMCHLNTR